MKLFTTITLLIFSTISHAQFETFSSFENKSVDSIQFTEFNHFNKIHFVSNTIEIKIDSNYYQFGLNYKQLSKSRVKQPSNDSLMVADYDQKYYLEITSFRILSIDKDSVNFKISYDRIDKKNGMKKGKTHFLRNYKIDKQMIDYVSVGALDSKTSKKVILVNLVIWAIAGAMAIVLK
jgi:hypothetical protein